MTYPALLNGDFSSFTDDSQYYQFKKKNWYKSTKTFFHWRLMLITLVLTLTVIVPLYYMNIFHNGTTYYLYLFRFCLVNEEFENSLFVSWDGRQPIMWLCCHWDKPCYILICFLVFLKKYKEGGDHIEYWIIDVVSFGHDL